MGLGDGNGDRPGDDYGLPPVDVVVPDDASELARDVLAYRRELRQSRRRQRLRSCTGPLRSYGGIPALALGAALLVAFAITMMSVAGSPAGEPNAPARGPATAVGGGNLGRLLPSAKVRQDGRAVSLLDLHRPGLLVLLPTGCHCGSAVAGIAARAAQVRVALYLVTTASPGKAELAIAARARQPRTAFVRDGAQVLTNAYRPHGLTVLLVHSDGAVGGVLRNATVHTGNRLTPAVLHRLYVSGRGDPALPSAA